ncbi:MAG: methyltransferase family protein [Gemmatimonadaceae bacterium]
MNRELARRIRVPLGFLLAAGYLLVARPTPLTLIVGASIAFVGLLVRGWASGHIVKNDRLATTGPYAHTRNPLYFGSFLIAAGFAMAAHWSLLLFVIAFFVLIYGPTMRDERISIQTRFPEAYGEWERNVPAFVPRPTPWQATPTSPDEQGGFDVALYMRHGEWRAALGYAAVLAYLIFRMRRAA